MGAGGLESLNEVKRTICTRLLDPICFAFGALGVPCGADSLPFVLAGSRGSTAAEEGWETSDTQ